LVWIAVMSLIPAFFLIFFSYCNGTIVSLHSFPTRRSSDLCPSSLSLERLEVMLLHVVDHLPAENLRLYVGSAEVQARPDAGIDEDRKSTRLNSSHLGISYAVFCLKKKNIRIISSISSRTKY